MKRNYLNSLLALLFIALLFTGCKKDDESPSSKVTYDGKSYNLKTAEYYSYQGSDDIYYIGLNIMGQGSLSDLSFPDIYFSLEANAPGLPVGDYVFNADGGNMTWDEAYFYVWLGDVDVDIASGTLKISKSGSTYTISFTGKDTDDKAISFNYKGAVTEEED